MTVEADAPGVLDAIKALDANPQVADHVAAWLGALDGPQREALRPQLQRIASAVQTIARLLDEIRAREADGSADGKATREADGKATRQLGDKATRQLGDKADGRADGGVDDRSPDAPAPWFESLARGLAAGDVARVRGLVATAPAGPDVAAGFAAGIAAGIDAWLDEGRPTREGELLHFWAQLRAAPGWPADGAAPAREAPLIACAHEARLYAMAGLDWLADDATARVERLGPRTSWAVLARAVRYLDRDELDDAESSYQGAAMRWPSSPESYAGLAAIAELRGFWTDAYRYYEHLAALCVGAPAPDSPGETGAAIHRLRAALFWVRSTQRSPADATGGLLALASHPRLRDADPALRCRVLERAIAGDCPPGAPWLAGAKAALAELLAQAGDRAAGPAFAELAASSLSARRYDEAAQFSRRAIEAGKADAVAHWTLADDLRLCEPSDPRRIDEAIAVWQAGFAIERPGWATSWALLARAMLGDAYRGPARLDELAATLFFGEWAVALAGESALYWSFLARFYRTLNAEATALALVERAVALDPASAAVREEHAVALASVGRSREALEVLDGLEASRTEPEQRWIRSVQGYVLADLGEDAAALARFQLGHDPWVAPVVAQVMRRLGDRDGADRLCREIWDDAARPELVRAAISVWIGQAAAGEALLARAPLEPTDDPHDVAAARAWLRAAQGDWDGADRRFQDAVEAIRTPRQARMLAAELGDVVARFGDGRADSEAARRSAAWRQRLDDRARGVELGPAAIAAERAGVARLLAGTRHGGFAALTALREAMETGDHAAIAGAAARLREAAPALCDAVLSSVAAAASTRADRLLARDAAADARELYARAAVVADSAALQVRRAWAAAVATPPSVEPAAPLAAQATAGDAGPALGALIAQVGHRRAWLAVAAFSRAGRAPGGEAWSELAARVRDLAPRGFTTRGTPNLPPPIALELPVGLADRERAVRAALPAARAEVASAVGFELPIPEIRRTASPGAPRILIDGVVIDAGGGDGAGPADEASAAQLVRAVRDAAWDQLARWMDVESGEPGDRGLGPLRAARGARRRVARGRARSAAAARRDPGRGPRAAPVARGRPGDRGPRRRRAGLGLRAGPARPRAVPRLAARARAGRAQRRDAAQGAGRQAVRRARSRAARSRRGGARRGRPRAGRRSVGGGAASRARDRRDPRPPGAVRGVVDPRGAAGLRAGGQPGGAACLSRRCSRSPCAPSCGPRSPTASARSPSCAARSEGSPPGLGPRRPPSG